MTENARMLVAILCGVAVIAFYIINALIRGNSKGKKFVEKAQKNGCVTTGKEIKHTYRGGMFGGDATEARSIETVTYSYLVNGKEYRKKVVYSGMSADIDYPTTVQIYYNKNNPSIAFTAEETSKEKQGQVGCYISIILSVLIIVAVYNLLKLI